MTEYELAECSECDGKGHEAQADLRGLQRYGLIATNDATTHGADHLEAQG